MKGFLAGVLWGAVVMTLGLAVASAVAPMPGGHTVPGGAGRVVVDASAGLGDGISIRRPVAADTVAGPVADAGPPVGTAALPDGTPDPAAVPNIPAKASGTDDAAEAPERAGAGPVVVPDRAPATAVPLEGPVMDRPVAVAAAADAVPVVAAAPAPALAMNPVAPDAPVGPASGPEADAPVVVADAPVVERTPPPIVVPRADAEPAPTDTPPASAKPTPAPKVAPAIEPAPAPGPAVTADAVPAPSSDAEAMPAAAPVTDRPVKAAARKAAPIAPAPDDALVILPVPATPPPVRDAEAPAPVAVTASGPAPTPGLVGTVDGVTTGRLPRIGAVPPVDEAGPEPSDDIPLVRYARAFQNPEGKPAFAIVLIDQGLPAPDRARLAALPFPITFALDPTMPQAAAAATAYRAAGQEVAMLATGIPPGATAADLEVTFEAHARALPEAVVVLDLETGGFQADRVLATQVVPVIAGQGRGVVTWDGGLNAGAQVAQRDGVAAGTVFRRFDPEGASVPTMRRMLDRAAFKAAQDGRVIVVGNASAGLTVALLAWSLEGRASSVALAPVTAVLTKPDS